MGKIFSIIGYLILGFIILSNYINIQLSNESVILLSVISVFFLVVGILIKEKIKIIKEPDAEPIKGLINWEERY